MFQSPRFGLHQNRGNLPTGFLCRAEDTILDELPAEYLIPIIPIYLPTCSYLAYIPTSLPSPFNAFCRVAHDAFPPGLSQSALLIHPEQQLAGLFVDVASWTRSTWRSRAMLSAELLLLRGQSRGRCSRPPAAPWHTPVVVETTQHKQSKLHAPMTPVLESHLF